MKKILFILHLPPPVHGSSIVGKLISKSDLINNSFDCSYINLLVSSTIIETGKFSLLKILKVVGVWLELMVEIIKKKPSVCYLALSSSGLSFYKDALLIFWLRLFRIKTVYHLHNKGIKTNQSKKIDNLLYRSVFKNANVILLSNKLYSEVETFAPISKVYICPNGIKDTVPNFKHRLPSIEKPVKILFLSNLIESKGVSVLLDACVILKNKGIDFNCDFVGAEGDLKTSQFIETVTQKGISEHVKYLGAKYGKEKQETFENADIFAFPTYYFNECFPLVLLEAMSFGLPVISTLEGGIPDIIEDGATGYFVPQRNAEMLAEKLEVLIKNPELRLLMGNAGRRKYENEFTLELFERRLTEILQKIIEQR